MDTLKKLKISQIKVGEHEQRISEDDTKFAELVKSIGRLGLINPIVVAAGTSGYSLVAGHRRLAAVKKLGYSEVECKIRTENKAVDSEVTFAENFCRKSLTPIEQAHAIKDVIDKKTMTIEEVAEAFHHTIHWVRQQVAICSWPTDVQEAIHNEILSVAAASNIAQVTDEKYRAFLLQNAEENGATARTTSAWLQAWRSFQPPEEAIEQPPVTDSRQITPLVPQAPCLVCANVYRTDELAHVPICQGCINTIRSIGQSGQHL